MGITTSNGVFNENRNKKMTKEPKLPHKLKWGAGTAARVDEAEYPIGIKLVGYTCLKDVFMKKSRVGAYYLYIKLKGIAHEEEN